MIESLPPRPISLYEAEKASKSGEASIVPATMMGLEDGVACTSIVILDGSDAYGVAFDPLLTEWTMVFEGEVDGRGVLEGLGPEIDELSEWVIEKYPRDDHFTDVEM